MGHQSRHIIFYMFYVFWVYVPFPLAALHVSQDSGKKNKQKNLIFWHTKFIWVLPILIQHISMAYYQPQEYNLRNNTKRWQVAKTCFLSFFLLSIIQLFLLQLPLRQVSANINSNIEIVFLYELLLFHPHIPEKKQPLQPRARGNPNRFWEI